MYQVRRVHIGKTEQLDELAHECGLLYSKTLVFFWRTVRHKGIWLAPKHLMRLWTSPKLHAHTSDACVQAFFAALSSWRKRRKTDPNAHPPRRRRWYFRIEYKRSAMKLADGTLRLSNGRGNAPLIIDWPWQLPQTVAIHWTGTEYEAIATYHMEETKAKPLGGEVAGIDLGEVHMAVSHDGTQTHILNGRLLRSKHKQLRKLKHQIKDIEHKQTTRLVSTLYHEGVQTVVIGDVRGIRQQTDVGSTNSQKLHQWSHGTVRHQLTYKAERCGMVVTLQEERHTSRTCPQCGHRRKNKPQGRVFHCTNKECRFTWHRDGVGACNIRHKYRGEFGIPHVVAEMAPATGIRFVPHTRVAREQSRENVCMGNCAEAAGL